MAKTRIQSGKDDKTTQHNRSSHVHDNITKLTIFDKIGYTDCENNSKKVVAYTVFFLLYSVFYLYARHMDVHTNYYAV
jgi:hypothetical protein